MRNEKVQIVNKDVKQKRPQKGTLRYTNFKVSVTRTYPMNFNFLFANRQVRGHSCKADEERPYEPNLASSKL